MSFLYFCASCGNNLTFISNRRLKCYKCGKYFTENFICECRRDPGFKFSAEIIAPNKVKCFFCGKEAQVPGNLEPPYIDKYKGSADSGGLGSWDGQVGSFQKPARKSRPVKISKQETQEIEKPEIDYESHDQIVIRFPASHRSLDQIRCEIVNNFLEVQSRLVDFFKKFSLPDFPVELETTFKNGVLNIRFKKKN